MSDTALRRHELAAFLRSRRERITPEDAGLPGGYRRRTAGLRREEVAQLSGVGVTWYTWLEQGRPIRASVQVLEAVARTLRLDAIERQHLFRLAEAPDTAHPDDSGPVLRPQIQVVLDGLSPMPASVVTERFDVLAWNAAYEVLFPRMRRGPARASGTRCCTCFTGPSAAARSRTGPTSGPRWSPSCARPTGTTSATRPGPASSGGWRRPAPSSRPCGPPRTWPTRTTYAKVFRHPLYPRLEMTSTSFEVQTRARHPAGRLHPGQRGHPHGHGTAHRGPGPASLPLLARSPGAHTRPSYDLGTSSPR